MENPEEVLQALDEFQKMRPTEIPRELEDYLSWVAKTGDPVYQWSLIKVMHCVNTRKRFEVMSRTSIVVIVACFASPSSAITCNKRNYYPSSPCTLNNSGC